MSTLSESFLQSLIKRFDDENTLGLTLAGSQARGEGGEFSDVDLHRYVREIPAGRQEKYTLKIIEDHLVSLTTKRLEDETAALREPGKAVWVVPGLRQARILLDKDGSIAALKKKAMGFDWRAIQAAADAYASWSLAGSSEEIHKILSGLAQKIESKTIYALWGLTQDLATAILIQRGVLIPTENSFVDLAQQTAGWKSEWTRQFRLSCGLDPLPAGSPGFIVRGSAGLKLYCESVGMLQKILLASDAVVIQHTLDLIRESGF